MATMRLGSTRLGLAGGPSTAANLRRVCRPAHPVSLLASSPLTTGQRQRSGVAAFFAIPSFRSRYKPKSEEETRQESKREERAKEEEQQRYHTLGDFLDRMPPSLRMLLVWSPVLLIGYFCCKQQRSYYLAEDEAWYCLLLPRSLRARLRNKEEEGHCGCALLAVPKGVRRGNDTAADGAASADRAAPFSTPLNVVAETKKQPDGHLITRLKQMTYMPASDIRDAARERGLATQHEARLWEWAQAHEQRSYASPRRWAESVSSYISAALYTEKGDGREAGRARVATVHSPPVKPFSTERVTITIGHPKAENEGLLGYLWSWAPTELLARMTGYRGETKKSYQALMKDELTKYYATVHEKRSHNNVWNRPLVVLRDAETGKVVGYTVNP